VRWKKPAGTCRRAAKRTSAWPTHASLLKIHATPWAEKTPRESVPNRHAQAARPDVFRRDHFGVFRVRSYITPKKNYLYDLEREFTSLHVAPSVGCW
jgi:hypothetical protein